jgi:hypothetical protein
MERRLIDRDQHSTQQRSKSAGVAVTIAGALLRLAQHAETKHPVCPMDFGNGYRTCVAVDQSGMTLMQRIALTLLIAALSIGSLIFMRGLKKGFKNNRNAMIACERSLQMYVPGTYVTGTYVTDGSLLPESYAADNRRWSNHFNTLIIWLSIFIISLVILTWTCPQTPAEHPKTVQIQEKKEQ